MDIKIKNYCEDEVSTAKALELVQKFIIDSTANGYYGNGAGVVENIEKYVVGKRTYRRKSECFFIQLLEP